MNDVSTSEMLDAAQLCQLMHFYADSGVDWLLEDGPVDRHAEYLALEASRRKPQAPQPTMSQPERAASPERVARERPTEPKAQPRAAALPDAEAVSEAQRVASQAETVEALIEAVGAFSGCNLRNSARNTAFFTGSMSARIAIVGGAPGPDDDRNGAPFSGAHGEMLARMLTALDIDPASVAIFNLIPWRPPGNRSPTAHEMEICRPFGLRLLQLLKPDALLAMGNLSARFLSGSQESIHGLRGRWMNVIVDGITTPMLPTFHPQDLIAAPACKRPTWQDLLAFKARVSNP